MSKNQKASGITNIISYDNSGNISFVSGSTTLMSVSSSGAVTLTNTMSGGVAVSASLSANSNLLQGTGSVGFSTTASLLAVSSSQQQISSSLLTLTASYTALSSSYTALSASYNTFSGSASTRVTQIESTYATTGSNSFRANQSITGSLVVSSTITAQTLVVQTVTSSIVYSSGSNIFGSALGDRQTFTGSIYQTGSIAAFAGSVGIGTTNPKTYSSLTSTGQIIALNNIGVDYGQSFRLNNYYNSGTVTDRTISTGYAASIGLDQTGGGFTFNISSVSASTDNTIATTERLRITSAGRIGIGTTSPDRLLTVNGDSTLLGNNYISTSKFFQWEGGAYWTTRVTSTGNQFEIYRGDTGASPFTISSANAATFSSSVTASTSITVNNSGAQEAVLSAVSAFADGYRAVLRLNNTHTGGKRWELYSTNNSDGVYSGGKLAFVNVNDSTTAMTITAAGNVGIGVTNPSKLFEVSGRMSTTAIVSNNLIAGQISSNLLAASSPNYILLFNMTSNAAGWSMAGYVNAAAWDCWNISTVWVRKLNDSFTVNAGVTGLYKSGCDFAICDVTYGGARYIALRFTSNPEIDVLWTGYGLSTVFQGNGTATVVSSGVSVNTIYAAY